MPGGRCGHVDHTLLRIGMAVVVTFALGLSLEPEPTRLWQIAEPFPARRTPHIFEFRTKPDAALDRMGPCTIPSRRDLNYLL